MKQYIGLAVFLSALTVQSKPVDLDRTLAFEVPDDWSYSNTSNRDGLRVYTFGLGSPASSKEVPVFLIDQSNMKASSPDVIRGISIGIARKPLTAMIIAGSRKLTRKGKPGILADGYRTELDSDTGKLVVAIFVFKAEKLPGPPLPDPETRQVIVYVAANTDEELEHFIEVFEAIKPVEENSNPETDKAG